MGAQGNMERIENLQIVARQYEGLIYIFSVP